MVDYSLLQSHTLIISSIRRCGKSTLLVQVCWELTIDNLKRALDGLWEAMRFFDHKEAMLVTFNQEDEFEQEGYTIRVLPFHQL